MIRDKMLNIFVDKMRVLYDSKHDLVQFLVYSTARLANDTAVDTLIGNFTITKELLEDVGVYLEEKRFTIKEGEPKVKEAGEDKLKGMVI